MDLNAIRVFFIALFVFYIGVAELLFDDLIEVLLVSVGFGFEVGLVVMTDDLLASKEKLFGVFDHADFLLFVFDVLFFLFEVFKSSEHLVHEVSHHFSFDFYLIGLLTEKLFLSSNSFFLLEDFMFLKLKLILSILQILHFLI
jgi:hypothetical protein